MNMKNSDNERDTLGHWCPPNNFCPSSKKDLWGLLKIFF